MTKTENGGEKREGNGKVEIEVMDIDSLTPYGKNAKLHPDAQVEQIAESIRRFGMNDPIGIWGPRNVIVEGHGRWLALRRLGERKVPCIRLDRLTATEMKEYALIHNKTTMNSGLDDGILEETLREIAAEDDTIDMSAFDFVIPEREPEVIDDGFDEAGALKDAPTIVSRGETWRLGEHILLCGDSTGGGGTGDD